MNPPITPSSSSRSSPLTVVNTSVGEGSTAAGLLIAPPAFAMNKKDCSPGRYWDALVNFCVPGETGNTPKPEPSTEPPPAVVVQLRSTSRTVEADPVLVLSPALWIFVLLATLGSILALTLWFIIYRRQSSFSSTSEDSEPQQEPFQKTEPTIIIHSLPSESDSHANMLQAAGRAPSPCSHLYPGAQTGTQLEEGFTVYRDPTKHTGTEGGSGLPACSTMREHRIPLPATELGGTALVTTKTM